MFRRLRIYKNDQLFAHNYESVRKIELSSNDLTTLRVPAYLGDEPMQTFDLYFVDFENLWHKLFSVTFPVESQTQQLQALRNQRGKQLTTARKKEKALKESHSESTI